MLRIRVFEMETRRLYTEKKIGGFLHLYIGQESVAVGAASVMEEKDYVMTTYRCHGHYLVRGGTMREGLAELMGKSGGCAKGRGGSMHFFNIPRRMLGGWAIIGAQVPVAAGVAFAEKYKGSDAVVLCYLGDGAINIGPFHEGLSLAALWKLPVIYIIENNYFSMGTALEKTCPVDDLSIRALGYPMARDTVDGHDIFAVRSAVHAAVRRAREKQLPTLIEAKTYRYYGHSMADPASYRTKEEVDQWKNRDPIEQMGAKLVELGGQALRDAVDAEVDAELQDAVQFAENSPEPDPATVEDFVYA